MKNDVVKDFEDGVSWIEHLFGLGSAPDHSEQLKKKAMMRKKDDPNSDPKD